MKKNFTIILIITSLKIFACGGYWEETDFFYNLFDQENISDKNYYPFLRIETSPFYHEKGNEDYSNTTDKGNLELWLKILPNWSKDELKDVLYNFDKEIWKNKKSNIEISAKKYIEYAIDCSHDVAGRKNENTWNYETINFNTSNSQEIIERGNKLLAQESNTQLQMRYYYQIIRSFHYNKEWQNAVNLYESKVENKFPKNEIYYYILDQVAGCYYSLKQYEKAAYLFTKVVNNSIDRKKSAYISFNFCTNKNADGSSFAKSLTEKKDLLLMKSLRNFSDEVSSISNFINLDANDNRVELLFMRAVNNVERETLIKNIGLSDSKLHLSKAKNKISTLINISENQYSNNKVINKDFWKMASSYLSFLNFDYRNAKIKLAEVNTFKKQKEILSHVYEVFSWQQISIEEEKYLTKLDLRTTNEENYERSSQNDWQVIIIDKTANTYYKNNQLAKAFLIHNKISSINNIHSLELINDLISFYHKTEKTKFELKLEEDASLNLNYLFHQKGNYYLLNADVDLALKNYKLDKQFNIDFLPKRIFSNNTIECFSCEENYVMEDEVYKADVFSFIKDEFSSLELANYLLKLKSLQNNEILWKAKLANYLLGNFYFNISNTGYYRGVISGNSNCCHYNYIGYSWNRQEENAETKIKLKKGYNFSNINQYQKTYFDLSSVALKYYQKTIELSTDNELNARCLYLMAKCELNVFYNLDEETSEIFEINIPYSYSNGYYTLELPLYENSFKILKEKYSNTKFYEMIITECSYFEAYVNQ